MAIDDSGGNPGSGNSTPDKKPTDDFSGGVPDSSVGSGASTGASAALNVGASSRPKTTKTCVLRITYRANGGKGDPPDTSVQTYTGPYEEVKFEETVKDNIYYMTRSTYWFSGWATSSDGSAVYMPGDVIVKEWDATSYGTQRYTLYAKWSNTKLYIYHPDDYSIERHHTWSSKVRAVETQLKGAVFTRTGYSMIGWATEKGGEKVYDLEQTITPDSNDIEVLYPVWEANTYTITFHPNAGEEDSQEDYVINAVYDSEITIPEINFTRTGYHQNGWNEKADGSDNAWFSGWTYTYKRAENVELYVVWVGDEYTVYYSEEAPGSTNYVHSSKAVYGSPFYTDRVPYPEGREYYTSDGWIADDNTVLTKQDAWYDAYSYGSSPIWTLQRDLVIYRRWSPYYPFGKIFFGGKGSDEYGIYVEEPPEYSWPMYSYTHHKAFGKNGDILVDPKRFENVDRKYKISAYDYSDYYNVAKKVSKWLHRYRSDKYIRLEDTYEPDTYMLAVYEESGSLENILAKAGKAELTFNCKPQKFLHSGDKPISITESGQIIHNPTDFISKPLIKFYGVGTIYINGVSIEIFKSFNYLTFDAESYNAYDDADYPMNNYVYTEDKIVLNPGNNIITYEGSIFDLTIVPRWWTI